MEQWEYLPTYIEASAKKKEIREFLKETLGIKRPKPFMVESLLPKLNEMGEQGWELVHMEPVAKIGRKGNVLLGAGHRWSSVYFCVFKRRKSGSVPQVMPLTSEGTPAFKDGKLEETEEEPLMPVAPIAPYMSNSQPG